jgi:retinol dehydrogenase-12
MNEFLATRHNKQVTKSGTHQLVILRTYLTKTKLICRPRKKSPIYKICSMKDNGDSSSKRKPVLLNKITIVGAFFVLIACILPIFLSEVLGGWTAKYTSPRPIFTASAIQSLTGQVAVVTGANTGIGYHTALEMTRNGATVIVAARSSEKGKAAVSKIQQQLSTSSSNVDDERVSFMPLDLASLASVKAFASDFKKLGIPLHTLVLNAGVMKSPGSEFIGKNLTYGFDTTVDGFEMHIGVNHIGHFYLTMLLQDTLIESAPSRIVSVSSMAEEGAFQPDGIRLNTWRPSTTNGIPSDYEDGLAYGQSKLANILFARELASRLNGTGVTSYSCHPGVIMTELGRYMEAENIEAEKAQGLLAILLSNLLGQFFQLSFFKAEDGALTPLHLATADERTLVNGAFYHPIGRVMGNGNHPQGGNETLRKVIWTESEHMIMQAGF